MKTLLLDLLNVELHSLNQIFFTEAQKIVQEEISKSFYDFEDFKQLITAKKLPIHILHELEVSKFL